MAWQRTIPFGYRMRQGRIERNAADADAVKDILTRYLQGESLQHIATAMATQGIRYHERTGAWNKNMVKRVLENNRYLGNEQYPRVISDEDFLAVQMLRSGKNTYAPCKVSGQVRAKAVCGQCGAKIVRVAKRKKTTLWQCENPDCGHTAHISDEGLVAAVNALLDELAHTPEALTPRILQKPAPSGGAQRVANELTNALNRGMESVSRFGRNTLDGLQYTRKLKRLGIGVYFEKENVNTLYMDNEMILTFFFSQAQAESESLSGNVKWGHRKNFKDGKVYYQYKSFMGYRKGPNGEPEIDEGQAAVVRRIFARYLMGDSVSQICKGLEEMARRSGKRRTSSKAKTELGKYSGKYAFSELLVCGECGSPYRRQTYMPRGEKYYVWRCLNRMENGTRICKNSPTFKERELQVAVIAAINEMFSQQKAKDAARDSVAAVLAAEAPMLSLPAIEAQLRAVQDRQMELMRLALDAGVDNTSFDEELQKIYAAKAQLMMLKEEMNHAD